MHKEYRRHQITGRAFRRRAAAQPAPVNTEFDGCDWLDFAELSFGEHPDGPLFVVHEGFGKLRIWSPRSPT